MRLPKNILSGNYTKPRIFLCEINKERVCQLDTTETQGTFKFNSYSELSFEVARIYNDILTGKTKVNQFYDKIESPRLILLENFGYFELQGPELRSDGIKEVKSCTAYSLEYTLSTKFLEDFFINTGKVDSLEVLNASDPEDINPIVLYDPNNKNLSLLHLALEKVYGWKIGHVDSSLQTMSRQFEVDRMSVYDFLMNEVCEKFNCYITFDTFNNEINIYAESRTAKFIGDGTTNTFIVSPPFFQVETVSVDGYKTTRWDYDAKSGKLILEDIPVSGAHIEVVDGALTEWETDVFVTFDNLAQEININYSSDDIKTVLTVTYGDDFDIREVNMGLPYITDLSYFYTVDWMGQDLYDAYTLYLQKSNMYQSEYTNNSQEMLEIANKINFEKNRLSLEYSVATSVNETTVGTYYVKVGESPNHYYKEVMLPEDYNVNTIYYSNATTNLQDSPDGNVRKLYEVLKKYFNYTDGWSDELNGLSTIFDFMESYTIPWLYEQLIVVTENRIGDDNVEIAINNFLDEMWNQVGKIPLESLYCETYKKIQATNMNMVATNEDEESGNWSSPDHPNYPFYYPVVLYINSIEKAIKKRDELIVNYQAEYDVLATTNSNISNDLIMDNNFTEDQMIRLSAFLREDELHLDDIVETSLTTVAESFKLKQDAMESGRIEMSKLCQPQLQFSMTMANIYAIPEFTPIIDQFQLGKVIKVGLRQDYIKQSRLLQVNLNFDDLSDFSCEFGELTSLRSQSDIHADLLSQAISAGKSVATYSSYWTKGADRVTDIDLRLQEGLLNSIEALKSIDGTQNAYMDKYGIHLEAVNQDTGEVDDKRVWMVNNQIVFTDDGFKTSKAALGEFKIGENTHYGLLAQAVLAGYIEGSQMVGGTIQIGLQEDGSYAFAVDEHGVVTMGGGGSIDGKPLQDLWDTSVIISPSTPTDAKEGQIWLDTSSDPYVIKILTNGEWEYFSQQNGGVIYTSQPSQYTEGDLWILDKGEVCGDFRAGNMLKAIETSTSFDASHWVDAMERMTAMRDDIYQTFTFSRNSENGNIEGLTIGQTDNAFYVNITSQEMGFYDNSDGNNQKVVSIGNKSATIKNMVVNESAKFDCDTTFNEEINIKGETSSGSSVGFVWKIESNGSLSLAMDH